MLYSQHVALHLAQAGHRGLHRVIDYTVRLLADTAADFIIRQGGWVCTGIVLCILWTWGGGGVISRYIYCNLYKLLIYIFGAGIAQWLERWTRDGKVAGSNPCKSGGRIFFSRVDFLC